VDATVTALDRATAAAFALAAATTTARHAYAAGDTATCIAALTDAASYAGPVAIALSAALDRLQPSTVTLRAAAADSERRVRVSRAGAARKKPVKRRS